MVQLSKREASQKVIREMKKDVWYRLEYLARKAKTGAYYLRTTEMAGFLRIAKALGILEHRGHTEIIQGKQTYVSEWRKIK